MEFYILELILCHLEDECRIGHKYIPSPLVGCHFLVFSFFEFNEGLGIVTFNPTGLVHRQRFVATFGTVFVLEAVLDYLKL